MELDIIQKEYATRESLKHSVDGHQISTQAGNSICLQYCHSHSHLNQCSKKSKLVFLFSLSCFYLFFNFLLSRFCEG